MATIKQYTKSNLTIAFMFASVVCLAQTKTDSLKQYFTSAKTEIEAMLSNKIPLDYERAVFITENAFYENAMDYTVFKENIDFHLQNIKFISSKSAEVNTVTTTQKITITKDSANKNIQRAFDNFAIYKYITDTTFFVIDSTTYYHPKFQYQFSDPFATKNWQTSQVTNLLNEETNTGNCNALTTLFKIFSLRLNSNAKLCTAPNHIFIRHANENGIFFNIELAPQSFPGTGSIETISYTTDQAARSGIAMRELDLKQSINLLLINLAKGYQHKFNTKTDKFILDCADLCLQYDNLNLNAMLLKTEYLNDKIVSSKKSVTQLQSNTGFIALQKQITSLYNLGYREMPTEMKNRLLSALMQDTTYLALSQNKTYNPFTKAYKTYCRSFSLSNGLFEEVNTTKPKEIFFNTIFDTKTKKITELKQIDNLYNNYEFDAVVFALSVDPLAHKYAFISPYAAFANNPILLIDEDGREPNRNQATTAAGFTAYIKANVKGTGLNGVVTQNDIYKHLKENSTTAMRYIYTKDNGWIDMNHVFSVIENGKTATDMLEPLSGNKAARDILFHGLGAQSYYSYEDLPSNKFGATIEKNDYEYSGDLVTSQLKSGDEILKQVELKLNKAGATKPDDAPNWNQIPASEDRPVIISDRGQVQELNYVELKSGNYVPQNHTDKPYDLNNFPAAPTSLEKTKSTPK